MNGGKGEGLWLDTEDCRRLSDNLADFLCWFDGFEAAHINSDTKPDLPPSREAIRKINLTLKASY